MIDVSGLIADDEDEEEEQQQQQQREAARCYRAALEFHKRGFNVVPRNPVTKHPAVKWKDLQKNRVTEAQLKKWRPMFESGVGLITGEISGVIVIETDGPVGEAVIAEFKQVDGALPSTFTVRSGSGRGFHRYFRHPGYRVTTRANPSIKLDVRGDGGFCVLPPTLHKSGGRYSIVSGVRPAPLPNGLLEFIEMKAANAKGTKSSGKSLPQKALDIGSNTNLWGPLPVNPVNVAIIASMLNALPDNFARDHDEWLHVGFALHDFNDGDIGLALWRTFSKRCPDKARVTDFIARWASFSNDYDGKKIVRLRRGPRDWLARADSAQAMLADVQAAC